MRAMRNRWATWGVLALLAGAAGTAYADGDTWDYVASMPGARSFGTGGEIDGLCYRVGGRTLTADCTYSSDLFVYDPGSDSWTTKASMPTKRDSPAGGVVDGKLYVAGGGTGCGVYTSKLEVYDP